MFIVDITAARMIARRDADMKRARELRAELAGEPDAARVVAHWVKLARVCNWLALRLASQEAR